MSRIYEIMFLIDNEVVRAGWQQAKSQATALLEKHGGKVLAARRWDERKLAYPIRRRRRGTYLLSYCELGGDGVATLRRELDISEVVLRYLILRVESVPPKELELTRAESAADFRVPEPPQDDAREGVEDRRAEAAVVEEPPEEATEEVAEPVTAGEPLGEED